MALHVHISTLFNQDLKQIKFLSCRVTAGVYFDDFVMAVGASVVQRRRFVFIFGIDCGTGFQQRLQNSCLK